MDPWGRVRLASSLTLGVLVCRALTSELALAGGVPFCPRRSPRSGPAVVPGRGATSLAASPVARFLSFSPASISPLVLAVQPPPDPRPPPRDSLSPRAERDSRTERLVRLRAPRAGAPFPRLGSAIEGSASLRVPLAKSSPCSERHRLPLPDPSPPVPHTQPSPPPDPALSVGGGGGKRLSTPAWLGEDGNGRRPRGSLAPGSWHALSPAPAPRPTPWPPCGHPPWPVSPRGGV